MVKTKKKKKETKQKTQHYHKLEICGTDYA